MTNGETTELPDGPTTLQAKASHTRSFSYTQMQQMGLSKAIDEYHRLLETGDQINTPASVPRKNRSNSNFVSSILKATVVRPLPTIARPETIIACFGALWSIISTVIYYSTPIIIPLVVWLALAPAAPLQLPAQLTKAYPALIKNSHLLHPPADWKIRAAIVFVVLLALRAAEIAVLARANHRREAAEHAITPERLENLYSGHHMSGYGSNTTASQDWQGVVKEVCHLAQQYEDEPSPVSTRSDALAWMDRVASEVGLEIPREAHNSADLALKAVEQFSSSLSSPQHTSKDIIAGNHPKYQEEAFVTLIYSDDFVLPVRVLGHSLKKTETKRDLVVVVAGDISNHNLATLAADGWRIYRTEAIQNPSLWTQNGGHGFPQRFWGVYTKLMIFNLTNSSQSKYRRVVYLDADTVAARNIDELFLCDATLCGVLRHSERFNSGVMVLEPSEDTLKDMLRRISSIPSYTGGDQGFLNEYFPEFANSPLFDPSASSGNTFSSEQQQNPWKDSKGRMLARLPTIYNADLGLYVANSNRWMLPRESIGVLHYTLGTFKPWQWYSSWILSENGRHWQYLRSELPVYKLGKDGDFTVVEGQTQKMADVSMFFVFRLLGPWLLSIIMVRRWCWNQGLEVCVRCWMGCATGRKSSNTISSNKTAARVFSQDHSRFSLPPIAGAAAITPFFGFDAASALAGFASLGVSLYIAVVVVIPIQIEPIFGWILAYEWITFLTLSIYGIYLGICFKLGKKMQTQQTVGGPSRNSAATSTVSSAATAAATSLIMKGSSSPPPLSPRYMSMYSSKKEDGEVVFVCGTRPWGHSLVACGVLIATLGLLPWWTDLLRVTSFIGKVVGTAAAGAISTAVCMQCFLYLAQLWFISGTLEKCTVPASLIAGSSSLLPILSSGKD